MDRILARGTTARQSGFVVVIVAGSLAALGLVYILSVTMVPALRAADPQPWYGVLSRQVMFIAVAAAACFVLSRVDYHRLVDKSWLLLGLIWVGLLFALIFAPTQRATRRWLMIGGYGIQVSEFAKLVIILCCARWVSVRSDRLTSYMHGFLPVMGWLGVTVVLIALAPDFGTSMFLLGTALVLLHLGGVQIRHILPTGAALVVPFVLFMASKFKHILERVNSFASGDSWQVSHGLIALGSGGVTGSGLGGGRAHLWFLPEVRNDFVFAAVGEQMGLLGTSLILVLFLVLLWHGLKITLRAPDTAGFIVAFGITFMIVFQAAINMAVVTGLVPPKGISLPFVSYGGSSILMLGCALGVLVNVSSQAADRPAWRTIGSEDIDGTRFSSSTA